MLTKLSDYEALGICDCIRDKIMREDSPLVDRLRDSNAIAQIMNLAQETIERKEK